jgi:hypothetical protein
MSSPLQYNAFCLSVHHTYSPGATSKAAAGSNTPKHAARFLKHLNHVLDPKKGQEKANSRPTTGSTSGGANNNKSSQQQKAKNNEFLQPHRGAGGTQGAPRAICVLGLMHTILCDDSLSQLEVCYGLVMYPAALAELSFMYLFIFIFVVNRLR